MLKIIIILTLSIGLLHSATYKISSYNVENLFDLELTGREYKQYIPGTSNWGLSTYMIKLKNTATVVSKINADVIALQEIESQRALDDLKHKLSMIGTKYKYSVFAVDSNSTTSTAILSKFPISDNSITPVILGHNNHTRPILKANINFKGNILTIFVVHWPSKMHKESFRVIAAKTLINQIRKLPKETEYLLLGDFNSDFDEGANILTENSGKSSEVSGINHILKTGFITDNNLFKIASQNDVRDELALFYNPWIDIKSSNQYSYIYKGEKNCIDNILIPSTLLDNKNLFYRNNSFRNYTLNNELIRGGVPYRWQTSRNLDGIINLGRGYSDHLPISIEITDTPTNTTEIVSPQHKEGSFEFSQDGWLIQNNNFRAKRVNSSYLDGDFSFNIKGKSRKNCTILKAITVSPDTSPYFFIKGEGVISIRYRNGFNKPWIYWHDNSSQYKSARGSYNRITKDWEKIILLNTDKTEYLEVQLRGKGDSNINFYIDKSNINGWFRD